VRVAVRVIGLPYADGFVPEISCKCVAAAAEVSARLADVLDALSVSPPYDAVTYWVGLDGTETPLRVAVDVSVTWLNTTAMSGP
jgi:hypothetical protein